MTEFSFHFCNAFAQDGLALALHKLVKQSPVVVVCIGSDLSIGDSLGPWIGSKLQQRWKGGFVYGTLRRPITAYEVKYLNAFLKQTHPNATILAVDAAVGNADDVGMIRLRSQALKPGSGANKNLSAVGDLSIMGIVAERGCFRTGIHMGARLNLIDQMSTLISQGILQAVS